MHSATLNIYPGGNTGHMYMYMSFLHFHNSLSASSLPSLLGAEAIPELDVSKRKYIFRILLPSSDDTGEIRLFFDTVSYSYHLFFSNP